MKNYVRISLETHLFFARIMKEHSLFLQAGFVQKDTEWIRRADFFRRQFEDLHRRTVQMSNRMISDNVLNSEELVTRYTMDAERKTSELSGLPIDRRITAAQREMECGRDYDVTREDVQVINRLNERAVWLLNGLIDFKERLLNEVKECRMYTANYPLLIDHITREARLYRETIEGMMNNQKVCYRELQNQEEFWNRIMMEHALFIRGLLDPSEDELICTADELAQDFKELLEAARRQDCRANNGCASDCRANDTYETNYRSNNARTADCRDNTTYEADYRSNDARNTDYRSNNTRTAECCDNNTYEADYRSNDARTSDCYDNNTRTADNYTTNNYRTDSISEKSLEKTLQIRDFKAAGAEGLLNCEIKSIILPLLADHVLREANHYIRILEHGYQWQEG